MVEEGDFPIKKQNQAILGSIITCGLLYMLLLLRPLRHGDVGRRSPATAPASRSPRCTPSRTRSAPRGFWAVWLWIFGIGAALFPITTSVLGFWLSSVRMLFAMGRQNFLPKAFAKTNRHHQPILPNLLILGISLAAIITMNYSNFLQNFFTLMAFAAAACYAIISAASIRAAVKHPDWERPYKIPGGMFMRVLSLIISVVFAFLTVLGQAGYTVMLEYLGIGAILWIWMIVVEVAQGAGLDGDAGRHQGVLRHALCARTDAETRGAAAAAPLVASGGAGRARGARRAAGSPATRGGPSWQTACTTR